MGYKINIEACKVLANSRHGKLLSTEYKSSASKLLWQCNLNHTWQATWGSVKSGSWCLICAKKEKYSIDTLRAFALNKGGSLLSAEYKNANVLLLWKCHLNHTWQATWSHINNRHSWCPKCAGNTKPELSELHQMAFNKLGKLLSVSYMNCMTKLLWECSKGHKWEATWDRIKLGNTWCPVCSSWQTELKCKSLLEDILKVPFNKVRFYYDKNNKHKYYEFDGYNEEHKIAFEYQGYQHYIYPNRFHKTRDIFIKAQQRDKIKKQYCIDNGIKLIIIPHTRNKDLESAILESINEL